MVKIFLLECQTQETLIEFMFLPYQEDGSFELVPDVGSILVSLDHNHGTIVDTLRRKSISEQGHVFVHTSGADT